MTQTLDSMKIVTAGFLLTMVWFASSCSDVEKRRPSGPIQPPVAYDRWTVYNASNSGLPDKPVRSIAIDRRQSQWIATYGGGLSSYDGSRWTTFSTGIPTAYVNVVAIDLSDHVWIGTDGSGLVRFDGLKWMTFDTGNSLLPDDVVNAIHIDILGNKWIATPSGMAKFDGSRWQVYKKNNSELPEDEITALASDVYGNLWIGTGTGFVVKLSGTRWTIYDRGNSTILSERVSAIAIEPSGIKWIGTAAGMVRFDDRRWTDYPSTGVTIDGPVNCIAIDASKNIWAGTSYDPALEVYQGGLVKFDGTNWTLFMKRNSGLPDNDIRSIAIDADHCLWIGTQYGGLARYCEGSD